MGVQQVPSGTAESVAFMRALAVQDARLEVRGADTMARLFLADHRKAALGDEAKWRWIIESVAGGTYPYLVARTAFFDQVVGAALDEATPQLVFLGAGYDSRPYRFRERVRATRLFEVDAAPTQARKVAILKREAIEPPPSLTYVPADLAKQPLAEVLSRAGFVAGERTLFVWEGVIYYLDEAAVDATLRAIRRCSAPGSAVAFDHVMGAGGAAAAQGLRASMRANHPGEPIRFRTKPGEMEPFLKARGFALEEELDTAAMEQRYLRLSDGSIAGAIPPVFRLTIARAV